MWTWISENYITILALLGVGLLIAGAVVVLVRQRKKGTCGGGCASCPYCGACHSAQKTKISSETQKSLDKSQE